MWVAQDLATLYTCRVPIMLTQTAYDHSDHGLMIGHISRVGHPLVIVTSDRRGYLYPYALALVHEHAPRSLLRRLQTAASKAVLLCSMDKRRLVYRMSLHYGQRICHDVRCQATRYHLDLVSIF